MVRFTCMGRKLSHYKFIVMSKSNQAQVNCGNCYFAGKSFYIDDIEHVICNHPFLSRLLEYDEIDIWEALAEVTEVCLDHELKKDA